MRANDVKKRNGGVKMTEVTSKYKLGRIARRLEAGEASIVAVQEHCWIVSDPGPRGYGDILVPVAARPTWLLLAGPTVAYQVCGGDGQDKRA